MLWPQLGRVRQLGCHAVVGYCTVIRHGRRTIKAIGLEQHLVFIELRKVGGAVRVRLVEATAIGLLRVGTMVWMVVTCG